MGGCVFTRWLFFRPRMAHGCMIGEEILPFAKVIK